MTKMKKEQLEFLNWEFGVFFHFGIRTFNEGHKDWDMEEMALSTFNPTDLDCDEWLKTVSEAGAKYAILVCKHHDGFALFRCGAVGKCQQQYITGQLNGRGAGLHRQREISAPHGNGFSGDILLFLRQIHGENFCAVFPDPVRFFQYERLDLCIGHPSGA